MSRTWAGQQPAGSSKVREKPTEEAGEESAMVRVGGVSNRPLSSERAVDHQGTAASSGRGDQVPSVTTSPSSMVMALPGDWAVPVSSSARSEKASPPLLEGAASAAAWVSMSRKVMSMPTRRLGV